jgi:hypothetical protein
VLRQVVRAVVEALDVPAALNHSQEVLCALLADTASGQTKLSVGVRERDKRCACRPHQAVTSLVCTATVKRSTPGGAPRCGGREQSLPHDMQLQRACPPSCLQDPNRARRVANTRHPAPAAATSCALNSSQRRAATRAVCWHPPMLQPAPCTWEGGGGGRREHVHMRQTTRHAKPHAGRGPTMRLSPRPSAVAGQHPLSTTKKPPCTMQAQGVSCYGARHAAHRPTRHRALHGTTMSAAPSQHAIKTHAPLQPPSHVHTHHPSTARTAPAALTGSAPLPVRRLHSACSSTGGCCGCAVGDASTPPALTGASRGGVGRRGPLMRA